MNKLAIAVLAFVVLAFAGCNPGMQSMQSTQHVEIHSTYNPDEIAYMKIPGNNTVKVNAFLRQRDGGNVTCAGNQIILLGVSTYATERLTAVFGSVTNPRLYRGRVILPAPPDPRYREDTVEKTCDSNEWTTFENVADGDYYLTANVVWETATGYNASMEWNGVGLMRKVSVSGGETVEVIVSR